MNIKLHRQVSLIAVMLIGLVWFSTALANANDTKINKILESDKPPVGVVFEIIASKDGLRWAVPQIRTYITLLKARHPKMKFAIVSHGRELVAMTKQNAKKYQKVHEDVKKLVKDTKVPFHVCETHAGWRGAQAEDFPKYVTMSVQGPTEVRNYKEFGYVVIILRKPKTK